MIVTKIPLRVSLAGGGTDLPVYYLDRGVGEVLNFAIDRYIYIVSSRFHDQEKTNFKYSVVETVSNFDDFNNPIVREVLKFMSFPSGFQFASLSDIPGGTGLGSSSAFCVGLISNVAKRLGKQLTQVEAAELACHVEIDLLNEPIGKQDQFGCAIGGIKHITFSAEKVDYQSLVLSDEIEKSLLERMVLIRVGTIRSASEILSNVQKNKNVNLKTLDKIRMLVPDLRKALIKGDIEFIGNSLHENWELKKTLDKNVSEKEIDNLYEKMVPKFAYGGKLLGAGGSGFLLFFLKKPLSESKLNLDISPIPLGFNKTGVISSTI